MTPFVANTDREWFDYLRSASAQVDGIGRLDEANFWQPRAQRPMRQMARGELVFFRLKRPTYAVAGYGYFSSFTALDLEAAWRTFGWKNGDPDQGSFLRRIGKYRGIDLTQPRVRTDPIGCTVLTDCVFWPEERWLPWGQEQGWHPNVVQGATENDPHRLAILMAAVELDGYRRHATDSAPFQLVEDDGRRFEYRAAALREGQGAFRLRLLDAYGKACAVTGEHTQPVLDAAHIHPYRGPQSNHVQNGIIMTKEFHALFDNGYVGITPDYAVRVSDRLRADYQNGKRYYPYDGQKLRVPTDASQRPSKDALAWHLENRFLGTG